MKVLIVDDEVIIRTGLSTVIDWQGSGFTVLEPAASAEEALNRIPEEEPDIVFTDIRMTGLSGIELAREIRKTWPDTELIVISGFDEFAYAQQAMREGVSEYLLKTSRPDEVIQAAMRAKGRIEQRRQLERQGKVQEEAANRGFLRRVLGSSSPPDEGTVAELLDRYPGFRVTSGKHHLQIAVITLRLDPQTKEKAGNSEELYRLLGDKLSDHLSCSCEWLQWNETLLLLVKTEGNRDWSSARLESAVRKAGKELDVQTFTACGQPVGEVRQLRLALETAVEAASYEWLLNGRRHVFYENIRDRKGIRSLCTLEEERELAGWLRSGDGEKLRAGITKLVERVRSDPEATPESVQAYFQSLIVSGQRWLERAALSVGRACEPAGPDAPVMAGLAKQPDCVLLEYFEDVMVQYAGLVNGANPVQRATAYIDEHLDQGLSLQQVAKHVHMNPNYFSEMFKRETGQNYIEYVTRARMRRAMSLLTETPAKISEVANSVGYEDLKYFNRLFKKFTGVTPSEYRSKTENRPSID